MRLRLMILSSNNKIWATPFFQILVKKKILPVSMKNLNYTFLKTLTLDDNFEFTAVEVWDLSGLRKRE